MVTKLAPVRLVGLGMGGWFLSTGIGNNLSGIFASEVSGESGMTTASALSGYTFGFWALIGGGRGAVPARAAGQQADAWREIATGAFSRITSASRPAECWREALRSPLRGASPHQSGRRLNTRKR